MWGVSLSGAVFSVGVSLTRPRVGGNAGLVGAVTEPHTARRLLTALGLAAQPPPADAAAHP